jgi:hypothetical protein
MFVHQIIYIDVNNKIGSLFTTAKQHMDAILILCVWDVFVYVRLGDGEGKVGEGIPLLNFLSSLHLKDVCWLQ